MRFVFFDEVSGTDRFSFDLKTSFDDASFWEAVSDGLAENLEKIYGVHDGRGDVGIVGFQSSEVTDWQGLESAWKSLLDSKGWLK